MVKVEYPLKQGLKRGLFPAIQKSVQVKVEYPLKQGLKLPPWVFGIIV